jgi:methylisocitrate lyase
MKKTSLLKKYINDEEILIMPGAHDVLSARIIETAGFKTLTMGGYSASASLLGQPDVSLLSLTEMVDCYGFGGVLNVRRTVKEFERAGAAGMFIEDQVFPKRCGHMEGKQVIETEEMVAKVKAAVDARLDEEFVIMARTDALAVKGLEEAIERGNLYSDAGADMIFVEAPRTVEEMRIITSGIKVPTLANNIEGGKSPLLSAQELQKIGYAVVVFPVAATYAMARAVGDLMVEIKKFGTSKGFLDRMLQFDEFNQLIKLHEIRSLESRFYR